MIAVAHNSTALGATAWAGAVAAAADALDAVSLEQVQSAALMNRVDTKFLVSASLVPAMLATCADDYAALEVESTRLSRYSTIYFDTRELTLYHQHHSGRLNRHKVRIRTYEDPGTHFLEVKLKTNRGRTHKSRVSVASPSWHELAELDRAPLRHAAPAIAPAELHHVLRVDYTRLTLVSRHCAERVTIDLLPRFTVGPARSCICAQAQTPGGGAPRHASAGSATAAFPAIAMVEVKQDRRARSRFRDLMRELHIQEGSMSKYCLGVASLYAGVKSNRFKQAIRRINGIG